MAGFSGLVLVGVMILVALDVALRYMFASPLFGAFEVVEFVLVIIVMLAIPYCTATDGQIRVDVLDPHLGPKGKLLSQVATSLVSLTVLIFLCYRTVLKAMDAFKYGDATPILGLPKWPLYAFIVIGMGGYIVVVLRDQVAALRPGRT